MGGGGGWEEKKKKLEACVRITPMVLWLEEEIFSSLSLSPTPQRRVYTLSRRGLLGI